jgi:DNA-3-methyladenine glycosylase II
MGALIATVGPYGINFQPTQDLFEALSRAIVYQQLSGKAAATIYGRLKALTGGDGSFTPRAVQSLAFEDLRGAGLSRAKSLAILDLAEKTLAGAIPPGDHIASLSDAEIMERLTAVRGIGPWTVEMLLMFRLGRPDVLPATDLGVRKGFAMLYGHAETPAPAALLDYGEKWRPYRSVASWYLWRMLELDDGALPPP